MHRKRINFYCFYGNGDCQVNKRQTNACEKKTHVYKRDLHSLLQRHQAVDGTLCVRTLISFLAHEDLTREFKIRHNG